MRKGLILTELLIPPPYTPLFKPSAKLLADHLEPPLIGHLVSEPPLDHNRMEEMSYQRIGHCKIAVSLIPLKVMLLPAVGQQPDRDPA